jgi:anhydro-N-acetylmuramic acid kinase
VSAAPRAAAARTPGFTDETPLAPAVVVGLMSGTSLDGISAAVARFVPGVDHISAELLAFRSVAYSREQRERLLCALEGASPTEYCRLNFELGSWLADAAVAVLADAGVARDDVRAIASHGQTVWHEPGHSTWQFGEPAVIAERTGIGVVSDFRVRDIAAGGQGAPLVPIADALLFHDVARWRALQNLGGIGNVTIVPPGGAFEGVRAFDTGPGVGVIDGVTRILFPELPYDVDGALARRGRVCDTVVRELLAEPYFASPPPKSTGRELFTRAYMERLISMCRAGAPLAGRPAVASEDIVATAVELTAQSIADAFRRFIPEPVAEVVLSGGGARNPALVDAIAARMSPVTVTRFDDLFFDGEAKEAVAFALMGYLFIEGRSGNVPGATGARGRRLLGKWSPA